MKITKEQLVEMIKEAIEEQIQQSEVVTSQTQKVYDLIGETGKAMAELVKIKPELSDFLKASWQQMSVVRNRLKP